MWDMSTELKPNRQKAGTPAGGQFAPNDRPAGDVSLWGTAIISPEPSADQRSRARAEAQRRAAVSIFTMTAAEIEDTYETLALRLAEQEAAYEAFKRGEQHPDDESFAAIWNGDAPGLSEQDVRTKLASTIRQRELFDQGRLAPADILPDHDADAGAAVAHLEEKENLYSLALDCGGRNLSVNQVAVSEVRRAAESELLGVPF